MRREVVAAVALGDEGAQLNIFPCHFLPPNNARDIMRTHVVVKRLRHAVECHLCRVRDKGEHRVLHIAIYGFEDIRQQLRTQHLPFLIYSSIRPPREINPLKGAGLILSGGDYLLRVHLPRLVDEQRLPGLQLPHCLYRQVKRRLYHGALACQHHHFLVRVVERRSDAPRVAHAEHLTAARNPTYHITPIPQSTALP